MLYHGCSIWCGDRALSFARLMLLWCWLAPLESLEAAKAWIDAERT